jgi:hypothetical protein
MGTVNRHRKSSAIRAILKLTSLVKQCAEVNH